MNKRTAKEITPKGAPQYHIQCRQGDLADYLLIPGDPGRVKIIGKLWDRFKEVSSNRAYYSITGYFKSIKLSALSGGIGAPSNAIAIEEAARVGVRTFIRVGSTGTLRKDMKPGDLVISLAAVRSEGTSKQYVSQDYPAIASYEVVLALIEACEKLKFRYHLGITVSVDSFYVGEGRPGFKGYIQSWHKPILSDLQKMGVVNIEMESAALFTIANLYGLRAGTICAVFDNLITNEFKKAGERQACLAASEAVVILSQWDKLKKKKRKKYFYPSLLD